MNVKKYVSVSVISLMLIMVGSISVFANGITGWANENGVAVYYQDGKKLTNSWVSMGNYVFYLNNAGIPDATKVTTVDLAPYYGINFINGNAAVAAPTTSNTITQPATTVASPEIRQMVKEHLKKARKKLDKGILEVEYPGGRLGSSKMYFSYNRAGNYFSEAKVYLQTASALCAGCSDLNEVKAACDGAIAAYPAGCSDNVDSMYGFSDQALNAAINYGVQIERFSKSL